VFWGDAVFLLKSTFFRFFWFFSLSNANNLSNQKSYKGNYLLFFTVNLEKKIFEKSRLYKKLQHVCHSASRIFYWNPYFVRSDQSGFLTLLSAAPINVCTSTRKTPLQVSSEKFVFLVEKVFPLNQVWC